MRRFRPSLGRLEPKNKDATGNTSGNEGNPVSTPPARRARIKPKVGIVANRNATPQARKSQSGNTVEQQQRSRFRLPSIQVTLDKNAQQNNAQGENHAATSPNISSQGKGVSTSVRTTQNKTTNRLFQGNSRKTTAGSNLARNKGITSVKNSVSTTSHENARTPISSKELSSSETEDSAIIPKKVLNSMVHPVVVNVLNKHSGANMSNSTVGVGRKEALSHEEMALEIKLLDHGSSKTSGVNMCLGNAADESHVGLQEKDLCGDVIGGHAQDSTEIVELSEEQRSLEMGVKNFDLDTTVESGIFLENDMMSDQSFAEHESIILTQNQVQNISSTIDSYNTTTSVNSAPRRVLAMSSGIDSNAAIQIPDNVQQEDNSTSVSTTPVVNDEPSCNSLTTSKVLGQILSESVENNLQKLIDDENFDPIQTAQDLIQNLLTGEVSESGSNVTRNTAAQTMDLCECSNLDTASDKCSETEGGTASSPQRVVAVLLSPKLPEDCTITSREYDHACPDGMIPVLNASEMLLNHTSIRDRHALTSTVSDTNEISPDNTVTTEYHHVLPNTSITPTLETVKEMSLSHIIPTDHHDRPGTLPSEKQLPLLQNSTSQMSPHDTIPTEYHAQQNTLMLSIPSTAREKSTDHHIQEPSPPPNSDTIPATEYHAQPSTTTPDDSNQNPPDHATIPTEHYAQQYTQGMSQIQPNDTTQPIEYQPPDTSQNLPDNTTNSATDYHESTHLPVTILPMSDLVSTYYDTINTPSQHHTGAFGTTIDSVSTTIQPQSGLPNFIQPTTSIIPGTTAPKLNTKRKRGKRREQSNERRFNALPLLQFDVSEIPIASNIVIESDSEDAQTPTVDHPILELPVDLIAEDDQQTQTKNVQSKRKKAVPNLKQRFKARSTGAVKLVVSRRVSEKSGSEGTLVESSGTIVGNESTSAGDVENERSNDKASEVGEKESRVLASLVLGRGQKSNKNTDVSGNQMNAGVGVEVGLLVENPGLTMDANDGQGEIVQEGPSCSVTIDVGENLGSEGHDRLSSNVREESGQVRNDDGDLNVVPSPVSNTKSGGLQNKDIANNKVLGACPANANTASSNATVSGENNQGKDITPLVISRRRRVNKPNVTPDLTRRKRQQQQVTNSEENKTSGGNVTVNVDPVVTNVVNESQSTSITGGPNVGDKTQDSGETQSTAVDTSGSGNEHAIVLPVINLEPLALKSSGSVTTGSSTSIDIHEASSTEKSTSNRVVDGGSTESSASNHVLPVINLEPLPVTISSGSVTTGSTTSSHEHGVSPTENSITANHVPDDASSQTNVTNPVPDVATNQNGTSNLDVDSAASESSISTTAGVSRKRKVVPTVSLPSVRRKSRRKETSSRDTGVREGAVQGPDMMQGRSVGGDAVEEGQAMGTNQNSDETSVVSAIVDRVTGGAGMHGPGKVQGTNQHSDATSELNAIMGDTTQGSGDTSELNADSSSLTRPLEGMVDDQVLQSVQRGEQSSLVSNALVANVHDGSSNITLSGGMVDDGFVPSGELMFSGGEQSECPDSPGVLASVTTVCLSEGEQGSSGSEVGRSKRRITTVCQETLKELLGGESADEVEERLPEGEEGGNVPQTGVGKEGATEPQTTQKKRGRKVNEGPKKKRGRPPKNKKVDDESTVEKSGGPSQVIQGSNGDRTGSGEQVGDVDGSKGDPAAGSVGAQEKGDEPREGRKRKGTAVKAKVPAKRGRKKAASKETVEETEAPEDGVNNDPADDGTAPTEQENTQVTKQAPKKRGRRKKSTENSSAATTSTGQTSEMVAADSALFNKKGKRQSRAPKDKEPVNTLTMRISDMAYFNPKTNPMKDAIPDQGSPFLTTPRTQNGETEVVLADDEPTTDGGGAVTTEEGVQPSAVLAPQVTIDADGNIVLDEESLMIQATAASENVEDRELVFENANQQYKSSQKKKQMERWNKEETVYFYKILSQTGTDFSLMAKLFENRSRTDLKRKFKREEKINRDLIEKALNQRNPIRASLFADCFEESEKELEQSMEIQSDEIDNT